MRPFSGEGFPFLAPSAVALADIIWGSIFTQVCVNVVNSHAVILLDHRVVGYFQYRELHLYLV